MSKKKTERAPLTISADFTIWGILHEAARIGILHHNESELLSGLTTKGIHELSDLLDVIGDLVVQRTVELMKDGATPTPEG